MPIAAISYPMSATVGARPLRLSMQRLASRLNYMQTQVRQGGRHLPRALSST